jgi:molybdate transport system substrate-binding protein
MDEGKTRFRLGHDLERRGFKGKRIGVAVGGACLAAVSLLATGCGGAATASSSKPTGTVVVFAAASLKDAFDEIGTQFEKANPGVSMKFNFAGSSSLATQIKQGAPADVFASADTQSMGTVTSGGGADGTPQTFAKNRMEIIVAPGNPKHITSVADLAKSGVQVVLCASAVPCGVYAQEIFKKAGITVKPVSEETSVSSVVTKITLGQADAGIVYVTDVKAAGSKAEGVAIPDSQNVLADYPIVKVKGAPNSEGASAFIDYVMSPAGQKVLASFGFLPPGT